jgi:4'-phosphopantetheinyl transferase
MPLFHPPWSVPSDIPTLSEGEVHVWRAALDLPGTRVRRLARTLCDAERWRAGRFIFKRDKDRFVVCRGILREILGSYLAVPPNQLRFRYGHYGKPHLADESGEGALCFNLSHSNALAVFVLTRGRRIGVDLERIRADIAWEDFAAEVFTGPEAAWLRETAGPQRHRTSLVAWTGKEAYVKARGRGLSFPMHRVELSFSPLRLRYVEDDEAEAARWRLRELDVGGEYVAATAVEGDEGEVRCWDWR